MKTNEGMIIYKDKTYKIGDWKFPVLTEDYKESIYINNKHIWTGTFKISYQLELEYDKYED